MVGSLCRFGCAQMKIFFLLQLDSEEFGDEEEGTFGFADEPAKWQHNHLKELEIVGFLGRRFEAAPVTYLIENEVPLQQIIIKPCQ